MAQTRTARAPRFRLELEQLETREVLSGVQPTALEQLMLEQLNNIRANPASYGTSIGLDLSSVGPSQPLAWNTSLIQAARLHSQDMNANNYFGHVSPGGQDEGARLTSVGFPWTSYAESIAAGFASTSSTLQALIIDSGISDLNHRRDLLAIDPQYKGLNQIGIGIVTGGTGTYQNYYTIDTASTANTQPFLTGVVYNDLNHNGQYDMNEGLGNVTVAVQGGPSTTTFATGGYSLQLNPGTYTLTFSGGGLSQAVTTSVTVGQINYRLNVTTGGVVLSYGTLASTTTGNPGSGPTQGSGGSQPGQGGSTPPVQPNYTAWIQQVGVDLLQRSLTASEVNNYVSQLQHGTSTSAVINTIVSSPEYARVQQSVWVAQTGQAILGRAMTAAELSQWTSYLQQGGTQAGFVYSLLTSNYRRLSTGDWLNKMSQALLQRNLSPVEYSAWVNYLQAGGSRQVAVSTFMASGEYQSDQLYNWVSNTAQAVLGQPLSSGNVYNYVFQLQGGTTRAAVVAALIRSAPFSSQDHV